MTVKDADRHDALRRGRAAGLDRQQRRQQGRLAHAAGPGRDGLDRRHDRAQRPERQARPDRRRALRDRAPATPSCQKSIDQGVPTTIEGLSFTFDREAKFTGLSVASDPGTPARLARLLPPHRRLRRSASTSPTGASGAASWPGRAAEPRSLDRRRRPPRHRLRRRVHHHRHGDPPGLDGPGAELGRHGPWRRCPTTRSIAGIADDGPRPARVRRSTPSPACGRPGCAAAGVPMSTGRVGFVAGPRTASIGHYATILGLARLRRSSAPASSSGRSPPGTGRSPTCTSSRSPSRGASSAPTSGSSGSTTSASSASSSLPVALALLLYAINIPAGARSSRSSRPSRTTSSCRSTSPSRSSPTARSRSPSRPRSST